MTKINRNQAHTVPVVVGVIINPQGQVLIAKRKHYQHQGGCWEFPGGKMEPGESQAKALERELLEEVDIQVIHYIPWLEIPYQYPDKSVHLYVHKVTGFQGQARGLEGQAIAWLYPQALLSLPLPKANEAIAKALIG